MGLLDVAKSAFKDVVNTADPFGNPFKAKPKPGSMGVHGTPWWADLGLYDFATKQVGIKPGPYRIKLKGGVPTGGVELAPDYARGGRLWGTPDLHEKLQPFDEQAALQTFRQKMGRDPKDDEWVQLLVAAGQKPGPHLIGEADIRDETGRVTGKMAPGQQVGIRTSTQGNLQMPLRHYFSHDESDVNQYKVEQGYHHETDRSRLQIAAHAFTDSLGDLWQDEILGYPSSLAHTRTGAGPFLKRPETAQYKPGEASWKVLMSSLGLAGEAEQFAAENVGGGVTMYPADAARAVGLPGVAEQLESPVVRGGVGHTAMLLSGLPILSVTTPAGLARGTIATAKGIQLGSEVGAISLFKGRGAGAQLIARKIAEGETRALANAEDAIIRQFQKELGIRINPTQRGVEGAQKMFSTADSLTTQAGRLKNIDAAMKLQERAEGYREMGNILMKMAEEDIPLAPHQIAAAEFVRDAAARRAVPTGRKVYHGNVVEGAEMAPGTGTLGPGIYVSESPEVASSAATIIGGPEPAAGKVFPLILGDDAVVFNTDVKNVNTKLIGAIRNVMSARQQAKFTQELAGSRGGNDVYAALVRTLNPTRSEGALTDAEKVNVNALMKKAGIDALYSATEGGQYAVLNPKKLTTTIRRAPGQKVSPQLAKMAKMNGISPEGKTYDELLRELEAASAHVPEAIYERGLPKYLPSDVPGYKYVQLLHRARDLPIKIERAGEIVEAYRTRRAAFNLSKREAKVSANADRIEQILGKAEATLDEAGNLVAKTPPIEEMQEAARLAGVGEKAIEGKTAEQLVSMVSERIADIRRAVPKLEMPSYGDIAKALTNIPRGDAEDILALLRWQIPGETETAAFVGIRRGSASRVVSEGREAVAPRAVPKSVEQVVAYIEASPSATDRAARLRSMFRSGRIGNAVSESGLALPEGLTPEQVVERLAAFRNALKAGAPAEAGTVAQGAGVQPQLVFRLIQSGREVVTSSLLGARAMFDSPSLATEVGQSVRHFPVAEGTVKAGRHLDANRIARLSELAKRISIPALDDIAGQFGVPRGRISKAAFKAANEVYRDGSATRTELADTVARLKDIERLNLEIAKRVADATYLEADPRLAQAATRELRRQIVASRESGDLADAVRVLRSRLPFVKEGREATERQQGIIDAIERLINPESILTVSSDPRIAEIAREIPSWSSGSIYKLLADLETHNLGRGGDVGQFAKTWIGPLVRLATGRFTHNPQMMGLFWAHEMANNTGGLINGALVGRVYQLAEDLLEAPKWRAGLPRSGADRLSNFLRSHFINNKEHRVALIGPVFDKYGDEAVELYSGELAAYLAFPHFFKDMPKEFGDLASAYRLHSQNLDDAATALGVQADAMREASRESIITDKVGDWLRQVPADDNLKGVGRTWVALARALDHDPRLVGRGYSLKGLTKHGRDLLIDFNNARYRHLVQRRTAEAIAGLSSGARAEVFYTGLSDDVVKGSAELAKKKAKAAVSYINGKWSVSSHELWSPEIRPWLNGLTDVLSGGRGVGGPLGFVQDLFRSLMMGRLVLDASIMGIQGSFYASARTFMRPGVGTVGVDAMPNLAMESLKMTNSGYFTNWMWQNLPELRTYFSHGLSTGVEGLVGSGAAGARKMLLAERVPVLLGRIKGPAGKAGSFLTSPLGIAGSTVRGINDIMFDRWLLYMKVNLIRQHTDTVNAFRKAFRQGDARKIADEFMNAEGTGLNQLGREMGEKDLLYLGSSNEVLDAVIRVVNNQLGGITRAQLGRSQWRETAEQLTLMVPGFWRARLGLLTSAMTRPQSVEGQLALGQVMREFAFFASWAAMISMSTGNAHKLNLHDPRKPDWLAAQFGDFYIPIMPSSASSYRLVARLVGGMNNPSAQLKNPKKAAEQRLDAVRILLEGRMHPALQAVYEHINREDFLGNRLDTKQAQFLNYAQMLEPIFAEQMGEVVAANWKGDESDVLTGKAIATQGLATFMSKNIIPISPIQHLDDYAAQLPDSQGRTGRRWFELGQHERSIARAAEPRVEDWEMAWDETQVSKRDTTEKRLDAIFDRFPVVRTETKNTLEDLGDQLDVGAIDDEEFRDNFRLARSGQAERFGELEELMRINGHDPDKVFARRRENQDKVGVVDQAILDYNSVTFDDYVHEQTVETEFGSVKVKKIDFDGYDDARENALSAYDEDVRRDAMDFIRREEPVIATRYREAQQDLDSYFTIPKYKGFDASESAFIDSVSSYFEVIGDKVRQLAFEQGVEAPQGAFIRMLAIRKLIQDGKITTKRQAQMAATAMIMKKNSNVKKALLNPERPAFVIAHPDLPLFYRFVANDVPDLLKDRLNPVVLGPTEFSGMLAEREEFVA